MPRPRSRAATLLGRALLTLLPTLAILILHALAGEAPLFANFEAQLLNWRFQLRGPVEPGPEVVLITINDRTVAGLGRWPLSREHMAAAVQRATAAGARVIAFDLLFAEPEIALPADLADAVRAARSALPAEQEDLAQRLDRLLDADDPDRRFAEALRAAGTVLIPYAFTFDAKAPTPGRPTLPTAVEASAFTVYRLPPDADPRSDLRPAGLLAPPVRLLDAAAGTGHVTLVLDDDGSLRHEHPVIGYAGEFLPSLPLEIARGFLGLNRSDVTVLFGDGIQLGGWFVPTDRRMRVPVNHYGPAGTFETHSFLDLVEGHVAPARLAGRIVLFGGAGAGIADSFSTPFTATMPGTEHYATVIDNLLHGRSLVRNSITAGFDRAAIVIGGLTAAVLAAVTVPFLAGAGVLVLLAGWWELNYLAFARENWWLDLLFPTLAILVNYAAFQAIRVVREQRRRRRAERERANLARYFSARIVDALADRDEPFAFDRVQPAALMFIDMVGSTALSERLTPAEAMALLRDFHRRIERAVFAHSGTLNKFLGDGALAIFGLPEPSPADAANALACARTLAADVAAWSQARAAQGELPVRIGVGIHYGPVLMGDIGGEHQFEFTVAGDIVNVASRLEALTRRVEATLVASDAAVEAARNAGAESAGLLDGFIALPPQPIRGRDEPVGAWAWR
jgi:adenylate cyclase